MLDDAPWCVIWLCSGHEKCWLTTHISQLLIDKSNENEEFPYKIQLNKELCLLLNVTD